MTKVVVRFRDIPPGPPTSWVPPRVLRSPNAPSSNDEPPTSLGKGRGGCDGVGISGRIQAFGFEPTSLKRGEGLVSGLLRVFEGEMGGKGEGGGSGMGGGRAKLNRDGVDLQLKLRSPT